MEQITYNNISEKLIEKFSEFKSSSRYFDEEDKAPYTVLGNLSLMVFEDIDKKQDTGLAEKLVKLADEIFNNAQSDEQLVNLFAVEVLEILVGSKTGAKLAKNLLHGKSLDFLEQTLKHYNTNEFLEEYKK